MCYINYSLFFRFIYSSNSANLVCLWNFVYCLSVLETKYLIASFYSYLEL